MVEEQEDEEEHSIAVNPLPPTNEMITIDGLYEGDKVISSNENQESENINNKNINVINNLNIHIEHSVGVANADDGIDMISKGVSDSIANNTTTSPHKTPKLYRAVSDQQFSNNNNNNNSDNANNKSPKQMGFGTAQTFVEEMHRSELLKYGNEIINDTMKKLDFFTKVQHSIWKLTCRHILHEFKQQEKESWMQIMSYYDSIESKNKTKNKNKNDNHTIQK